MPLNFLNFNECAEMRAGYLVTVNLQHLYECDANPALRTAVFGNRGARLCLDGRGARFVFERYYRRKLPLAVGNEILSAKLRASAGRRVLIIGSDQRCINSTSKRYPYTEFLHYDAQMSALGTSSAANLATTLIRRFGRDYAFVAIALGVPKQEVLAAALAPLLPDVPILCVGGSFEMLSGQLKRAPIWLQILGLEGLWRFVIQPTRHRLWRLVRSYLSFFYFISMPKRLNALINPHEY